MKLCRQIKILVVVSVSLNGIVENNMDRPESKNALGEDFFERTRE